MVNVIIPVFHSKETLPNALKSLENQTDRKFLVTIVADGDGEDYSEIIDASPLNITYFSLENNSGPGVARQYGLDKTPRQIKWVMFLDADDYLNPRAIEVLTYEAEHQMADIVGGAIIREQDVGLSQIIDAKDNIVWIHAKLYSNAFLKDNNIRFPDFRYNEDCYFNNIAFLKTDKKFFVEEPLIIWKNNKQSITRNQDHVTSKINCIDGYMSEVNMMFNTIRDEQLKLKTTLKDPNFIVGWISNVYNEYMAAYAYVPDLINNETITNKVKEFFTQPEVAMVLKNQYS